MNRIYLICLVLLPLMLFGKSKRKQPAADMKQYYFVMLTKGANRTQDSVTAL